MASVQKRTPGDDLITVIVNVDGPQSAHAPTRDFESEIQVGVTVRLTRR